MAIPELIPSSSILSRRSFASAIDVAFTTGLSLKTEEGDLVNLSFESQNSLAQSETETKYADGDAVQEFSSVAVAAYRYSLSVQGDLNQEELDAIQSLVREIAPIARQFFARAEFDLEKASEALSGSLGVIEEVELALERVITTTFSARSVSNGDSGLENLPPLPAPQAVEAEIDPAQIRDLPSLVLASVASEFEAQAAQLPPKAPILRSLNDLMSFLRDQLVQFLAPLKHFSEPAAETVPQSELPGSSEQENLEPQS